MRYPQPTRYTSKPVTVSKPFINSTVPSTLLKIRTTKVPYHEIFVVTILDFGPLHRGKDMTKKCSLLRGLAYIPCSCPNIPVYDVSNLGETYACTYAWGRKVTVEFIDFWKFSLLNQTADSNCAPYF